MRITIILILASMFSVKAEVVLSQNARVTLSKSGSPLTEVLNEIENQTNYLFIINSNVDTKRKVSISAKNEKVSRVLNTLLTTTSIGYSMEGSYIILSQKELAENRVATSTNQHHITGKVVDVTGEPLLGVSILLTGSTVGVISDLDGNYAIDIPTKTGKLKFSYIGFKDVIIDIKQRTNINVTLKEDTEILGEVVVTAMGIKRKSNSLTYATQTVGGKDISKVKDANFVNGLQGKSAGLTITPNSGGAGGASKLLLRGNKSITGNNSPLIVVDGIPMTNNLNGQLDVNGGGVSMDYNPTNEGADPLSTMNADDIESLTILKGANAAALYGSAASNGVIMITTKKGKEGKIRIDFSSSVTFENVLVKPQIQNEYGAAMNLESGRLSTDSWGKRLDQMTDEELVFKKSIDGAKMRNYGNNDLNDFFKTGSTINSTVSLSGGSENSQSYFSYGNTMASGLIERNNFRRHNISFRQNFQLFDKKLKIDVALNYVNQWTRNRPGGGAAQNPLYNLYLMPRNIDLGYYKNQYSESKGKWDSNITHYLKQSTDADGNPVLDANKQPIYSWVDESVELSGPKQNWAYRSTMQNNPYWLLHAIDRENSMESVNGYISASYEIMKGLKAQGRLKYNRTYLADESKVKATTQNPDAMIDRGVYEKKTYESHEFYIDGMLTYNKSFPSFDLSSSFGATTHIVNGNRYFMYENATSYISGSGDFKFPTINPTSINIFHDFAGSGGSRSNSETSDWDQGLFGTVSLSYKEFLNIDASYREDWYRAFTQFKNIPHHYGYFSFGGNVLLDKVISFPAFVNHAKLRASYSEVGNSIPNLFYGRQQYNIITGALTASPYSDFVDPRPEKTKSFEVGLDASFFDNSLTFDLTFYNSEMHNNYLIANVAGKQKPVNSGVIRNSGIETSVSYRCALAKKFYWNTRVNFSYNTNKILQTYEEKGQEYLMSQLVGWGGKFMLKYKKGGAYGDLYATDFSYGKDGKIRLNSKGAPVLDQQNQYGKLVGNMNAKYNLGWSNTFSYKGAQLYFLIDGKIGGKIVSFTEAYMDRAGVSQRVANARNNATANNLTWTSPQGDIYPALHMPDGQLAPVEEYYKSIGGDINASQYVYDATNFRLRELSLGYTLYDLFGKSKNLSLSFVARNLFFLYKDAPLDPETSISTQNGLGNIDIFSLPTTRSYGFSVSMSF